MSSLLVMSQIRCSFWHGLNGVARMNRSQSSWVIVPDSHKREYVKSLYDLDHHFQNVINAGIFALIDCLIPGNIRAD